MFFKQTWVLSKKNLKITVQRHFLATAFRAFILPVAFMIFLSYARNLLVPPVNYGIAEPRPIRSLQSGMDATNGGRNLLVFVSPYSGGQIDQVIDMVSSQVTGKTILRYNDSSALATTCRSTLRGVTACFGAVVFNSSPSEGRGGRWNYTMRADGSLGAASLNVDVSTTDYEVFFLPLQRAVDLAIASLTSNDLVQAHPVVDEYVYTRLSNDEINTEIREQFQNLLINFMSAVLLIAMIGVVYHLSSFLSEERESGLSTLIEAMMPNKKRWVPQVCRLLSYWISFSLVYLPGWFVGSIAFSIGIFPTTNKAIVILYHLLAGCALSSWAVLGSVLFKKAQLSGISVTLFSLVLGVIVQVLHNNRSSVIPYLLGLLFTPCNYVLFIITLARFEFNSLPGDLIRYAPYGWQIPPIVFWIFLVIQNVGYMVLAFYAERWMHGTESKGRTLVKGEFATNRDPIELQSFTKIYPPTLFHRIFNRWFKRSPVVAVSNVSFSAAKGQVLLLLGANGAGKSTTLDAIAGLGTVTSGSVTVNGEGGIGICPQRNVLWPELTVEEHVRIWNGLKAPSNPDSKEEIKAMVRTVDLETKMHARAKTLSGGQKRKAQLACMLTGGSAVCAVDEVSSGLDPLSRRKIWDILMAIRGHRTVIMTTHFLDEEVLADKICIMSKGTLRAEGSAAELKEKYGGGYKITVAESARSLGNVIGLAEIPVERAFGNLTYHAANASQVARVVRAFEKAGVEEYKLSEPTIDSVFFNLAEDSGVEAVKETDRPDSLSNDSISTIEKLPATSTTIAAGGAQDLELFPGRRISFLGQVRVLFRKRYILFRRNWLPYVAAFLMPILVASIATNGLVKFQQPPSCNPGSQTTVRRVQTIANQAAYNTVQGPFDVFPDRNAYMYLLTLFQGYYFNVTTFYANPNLNTVNSIERFNTFVAGNHSNVYPGGIWAGDASSLPTVAYMGDGGIFTPIYVQNVLNNVLYNQTTITNYQSFNIPWNPDVGNSLQVVVYICLVFSAYAAFFGLYPCLERIRGVRLLEYSNGARSLSRWLAYLLFDSSIILVSSAITIGLLAGLSHVWYGIGYLFVVFFLFGICSTLLSYCISLYTASQLATFAFVAGYLAVSFLIYIICYLCMITYAPVNIIDEALLIVNFTVSLVTPMGSLVRALFISLNLFSSACNGSTRYAPGVLDSFGGPIFYLIWQSLLLFGFLLWYDSKFSLKSIYERKPVVNNVETPVDPSLILDTSTADAQDGLRVLNVTKNFGKFTAVDNVTFSVPRNEIFGLLGPNGAGKSTTQSMIRGDIQPTHGTGSEIYINSVRLRTHRAQARENLGVCPQLDSMDEMTVLEHLRHYARMRGLTKAEIDFNVQAVLKAVGLEAFSTRMGAKLSGGNKRRLMLGISILGNPAVLLLDEPSSGMDVVGQRAMWKTLLAISAGRAILLTTHSMEETSALANRVGIMAKRMLALGTIPALRAANGAGYYVHLVAASAPHTTVAEINSLRNWVLEQWPEAVVEDRYWHGQMRFSIPVVQSVNGKVERTGDEIEGGALDRTHDGIGGVIAVLEEERARLGIGSFSVSPTTLDTVFLNIVTKHNVEEEGYRVQEKKAKRWWRFGKK